MSAKKPKDIDEYLSNVPEPARSTLEKLRQTIKSIAPKATEVISYQMPTFRYLGMLVSFAAWENHCALYGLSASLHASFKKELSAYDTSKGTIRFPANKPLPMALVKKLIKARMADNEEKETLRSLKKAKKKKSPPRRSEIRIRDT
jgi:uncharacterized protein YdhG (YjbR/CyaY superfamily)